MESTSSIVVQLIVTSQTIEALRLFKFDRSLISIKYQSIQ